MKVNAAVVDLAGQALAGWVSRQFRMLDLAKALDGLTTWRGYYVRGVVVYQSPEFLN